MDIFENIRKCVEKIPPDFYIVPNVALSWTVFMLAFVLCIADIFTPMHRLTIILMLLSVAFFALPRRFEFRLFSTILGFMAWSLFAVTVSIKYGLSGLQIAAAAQVVLVLYVLFAQIFCKRPVELVALITGIAFAAHLLGDVGQGFVEFAMMCLLVIYLEYDLVTLLNLHVIKDIIGEFSERNVARFCRESLKSLKKALLGYVSDSRSGKLGEALKMVLNKIEEKETLAEFEAYTRRSLEFFLWGYYDLSVVEAYKAFYETLGFKDAYNELGNLEKNTNKREKLKKKLRPSIPRSYLPEALAKALNKMGMDALSISDLRALLVHSKTGLRDRARPLSEYRFSIYRSLRKLAVIAFEELIRYANGAFIEELPSAST